MNAYTYTITVTIKLKYIPTVLTPVIHTISMSPTLLQVGITINLTCEAMGGPRLLLAWLRNGAEITSGNMGMATLTLSSIDGCDFGNYTCIATIDDMQESSTVLVAPIAGKLRRSRFHY